MDFNESAMYLCMCMFVRMLTVLWTFRGHKERVRNLSRDDRYASRGQSLLSCMLAAACSVHCRYWRYKVTCHYDEVDTVGGGLKTNRGR